MFSSRDKRLALRVVSPPHYAARAPSPVPSALMEEGDAEGEGGRSPSPPPPPERITFITSFGGDEEIQDTSGEFLPLWIDVLISANLQLVISMVIEILLIQENKVVLFVILKIYSSFLDVLRVIH